MENWGEIVKKFILNEQYIKPSLQSFCESLSKLLESFKPNSTRDARLLEVSKQHLREIKNGIKRLYEEKQQLEERLKILEEDKEKLRIKRKK